MNTQIQPPMLWTLWSVGLRHSKQALLALNVPIVLVIAMAVEEAIKVIILPNKGDKLVEHQLVRF